MRLAYDIWRRKLGPLFGCASSTALRFLECGCGPGFLLALFEEWFPESQLIGLDSDLRLLQSAAGRTNRTRLFLGAAETLPFDNSTFDLVITLHMIEHLPAPELFLKEARRVLKPGGFLVLATPNSSGIGARLMGCKWKGWRYDHLSVHAPAAWRTLLKKQGFRIREDGTTALSGIPGFRIPPLSLVQWVPLFVFGFFPWDSGESYIAISEA
jgi:ubiquinone/menaquinone biosynthesis C-methylase UbiE